MEWSFERKKNNFGYRFPHNIFGCVSFTEQGDCSVLLEQHFQQFWLLNFVFLDVYFFDDVIRRGDNWKVRFCCQSSRKTFDSVNHGLLLNQ